VSECANYGIPLLFTDDDDDNNNNNDDDDNNNNNNNNYYYYYYLKTVWDPIACAFASCTSTVFGEIGPMMVQ
jgi:zinc finger protein AEBP2